MDCEGPGVHHPRQQLTADADKMGRSNEEDAQGGEVEAIIGHQQKLREGG